MHEKYHEYSVHKFGGSSLADASRFIAVKSLLSGKHEIIVVSAIKNITSKLQTLLDAAKAGMDFSSLLIDIENQHLTLIKDLLPTNQLKDITDTVKKDCGEIKDILHALQLTGDSSKETQNLILGYGELWAAKILALYLSIFGNVIYLDASTVLFAYEKHGSIFIDWEKSLIALEKFLHNKIYDQIVITGFIAATPEGKRTTLGRNGSDFSAAIFARLFDAKCLYIWTDVDGIFTADPQRVPAAFVVGSLSYKEALELAYFGAKILHPKAIAPVLEKQIPIYIKNSYRPEVKGTYISAQSEKSPYIIKGLTSIDNIALINIEGAGMIGVSGIAARVFDILHQANISVILITQASSEHSICFAVSNIYASATVKVLEENLQFEIEHQQIEGIHVDLDCAILAIVGDGMQGAIGVSGKLCNTLAKANINICAIAQGSSERNISVVLKSKDINKALLAVHSGFYLSYKTISIGLIGPGKIGSTLLQQIYAANDQLKSKYKVNLCVRGIMNSKKMLLSHSAIDLNKWQELLSQSENASIKEFSEHILTDDVPHAVIIDCTASQMIAKDYLNFLRQGINVITPNKHANAGDLGYYKQLKALTQNKNIFYFYEATVCAGLPIINTLQDIVKTGDKVIKVEGIVSGTLSYIFDELAKGKLFSKVILEAKQQGYTEPDPREDLSGNDVARKFVCLAREIGHDISVTDVKVHDLVPASLKACSVDEFMQKISAYDEQMSELVTTAAAKHEKLCYVGTISQDGHVEIALKSFSQSHPFARLKGSDNMLIFYTHRYCEQPLVIQGPGAGAEVTAAGIFADLLRLISSLS